MLTKGYPVDLQMKKCFREQLPYTRRQLIKVAITSNWNMNPNKTDNPPKRKRGPENAAMWFGSTRHHNYTVTTNVAKKFLSLKDRCFPKGHPLNKAFNRQTVKASSLTTPIMAKIITGKNAKILDDNKEQEDTCNFQKSKTCPLEKKCQS